MNPNTIVYTAIFGGFDPIYPPTYEPVIDHFCITDNCASIPDLHGYTCLEDPIPSIAPTPRRASRYYKINSHLAFPGADFTIWHGGNVWLLQPPEVLIDFLGDADIAVLRHSQRTCIYDEADVCIQWGKGDPSTIRKQMDRYRSLGYPRHNGLHMAFLIIRRNCDNITTLNRAWWNEVQKGSVRDQLSFDYVCWELGIEVKDIPGDIYSGKFYKRHAIHKGEGK